MTRFLAVALLSLGASLALPAQVIVLDNFSGGGSTAVISGTTWANANNVLFNGTTMTVGNTALNDNGWGTASATIDASAMTFITVVAQLDPGNLAPFFVIGFEDGGPDAAVFSVSTFSFTSGAMTTVQIPISSWGNVNPAAITGWTIGGGTGGVVAFRMTLDNLSLGTSAIPEPGTYAALAGLGALGFALWRRRPLAT